MALVYLGYFDINSAGDVASGGLVFKTVDENNGVLVITLEVSNTISTYRLMLTNNDMPVVPGTSTPPQASSGDSNQRNLTGIRVANHLPIKE